MNISFVSEKYSPHLYFRQNLSRGGILGRFLRLLLHAIHSHLYQLIYSPLWFSWTYKISTATAESRWGLGFIYNISLFTFESSIVFFSFYTLFMYKYMLSETIIRKTLKGVKPERKPYPLPPYGSRNPYKNNQSMRKTQVWHGILSHICYKSWKAILKACELSNKKNIV